MGACGFGANRPVMALSWRTTEASGRGEASTRWTEMGGVQSSATARQCDAGEHQEFCAAKGVGTAEMGKRKRKGTLTSK